MIKLGKKKRKILLWLGIILLSLFLIGYIFINYYLLPVKFKNVVVSKLEKATNRKVDLKALSYSPLKGIILSNIKIYDGQQKDFISVDQISCNILLLDLIKKKSIIIPSLRVNKLYLNLQRDKNGTFNLSEFIREAKKAGKEKSAKGKNKDEPGKIKNKKSKYGFFLKKVSLNNTVIDFSDYTKEKPFIKKISDLDLKAKISVSDLSVNLTGSAKIGQTESLALKGSYQILNKKISLNLNFNDLDIDSYLSAYASKLPLSIGRPAADIKLNIKGDLKTSKKITITADSRIKSSDLNWQGYGLQGDFDLAAKVQTLLSSPKGWKDSLQYEVKAEFSTGLDNCLVKHPAIPLPLKNISGIIRFDKDSIDTSKFKFNYNNINYALDLKCNNFSSPEFATKLGSEVLNLETIGKINKGKLKLSKFSSHFYNSTLDMTGNINNIKKISSSVLDINSKISLTLSDMGKLCLTLGIKIPEFIEKMDNLAIDGLLNSELNFSGQLSDKSNWQIHSRSQDKSLFKMPVLKIKGYEIKNISCIAGMQKGILDISSLEADIYNGKLQSKSVLDLNQENFVHQTVLSLTDLDLQKLIASIPIKEETKDSKKNTIKGLLDFDLKLNGFGKNTDTFKGQGLIKVKEGLLEVAAQNKNKAKIPILKDLFPFMITKIPLLGKITFNSVDGQFKIANKAIIIPNLIITGPEADLACKGTIDFDTKLDLEVEIHFLKEFYEQNPLTGALGNILMGSLGKYISKVKITGTIKEPKTSWAPMDGLFNKKKLGTGVKDLINIFLPPSK